MLRPRARSASTPCRTLAERLGATVLLKGPVTIVAGPDGEVLVSRHGTPALATAGTGDVLTGIVAAFLARGLSPLEAGGLAATTHAVAALGGHRVGLVAGPTSSTSSLPSSAARRGE